MSAMSAPKITLFIFYTVYLIVHNEKLRITSIIYIKIKKFIIYSIYFADMQTFYKKTLILCGIVMSANVCKGKFSMSAFIFVCRHADIKVYNITSVIIYLHIKLYFVTNKHTICYKLYFLRYSKSFVRNYQK